jgi:hypothetical protein
MAGTGGSGCNDGCCGPSGPDLSMMAAASNKSGRFRGELSGSQCLSIELGEDRIAGCVWSESDFCTALLRDEAISTAVSISQEGSEGVLGFLEAPSAKSFDALKGLAFGASAENRGSKDKTSTDVLHPSRFLGREKDSSSSSLLSVLTEPSASFSKTQALQLSLPHSSVGATVSLHPEELVALQLQFWASKARVKQQQQAAAAASQKKGDSQGKNKKKQQKFEKGVTLVVPGYFGQRERNVAKTAARLAGLELRHMFSRGLCATAAALFGARAKQALGVLQAWSENQTTASPHKNPVVMFVHVNSNGVEVSLVECEGPGSTQPKGAAGVNAMYYDRLVCVSSGGLGGGLEGVSGGSVMKHQDENYVHVHGGQGDCCGGHSHDHGHDHGHGESKGIGKGKGKGKKSSGSGSGGAATTSTEPSCYSQAVTELVAQVVTQQLLLADLTAADIALVLHSGQGSPLSLHETLATETLLAPLQAVPLLPVPEEDPARGGTILTAAELDSSKQYIDLEEDHSILVHCLSIAEDVLSTSVGMLYVESQEMEESFGGDDEKVKASIQCIYPAGTVIRKADLGPIRKQVSTPAVESKEFSDGSVSFFGSHKPYYKNPAYPKLLLVQYEPTLSCSSGNSKPGEYCWHWRPVTDVGFPLLTDNGRSLLKTMRKAAKEGKGDATVAKSTQQKQALLSCKVNFKMNESQGLLTLEHAQGSKVAETVKSKSQVAKIAYIIGGFCLLVLAYFAYGEYIAQEEYRQDTAWLTDFYETHAPQVSVMGWLSGQYMYNVVLLDDMCLRSSFLCCVVMSCV